VSSHSVSGERMPPAMRVPFHRTRIILYPYL